MYNHVKLKHSQIKLIQNHTQTNLKTKVMTCLQKNFRKVRLKRKTNQESKQKKANKTTNNIKKGSQPNPFFLNDFSQVVCLFLS